MKLNLVIINELLAKASNIRCGSIGDYYSIPSGWSAIKEDADGDWAVERQGHIGELKTVFKVDDLPFQVQITFFSDSYGESMHSSGKIQFVKAKEVTVTDYVPL